MSQGPCESQRSGCAKALVKSIRESPISKKSRNTLSSGSDHEPSKLTSVK